ncbi:MULTISPECIES: hypothetical protein [unclassified Acinetobacter]|uniref:hypothetical protein n=1 Tax=unclassified Acinetobacter TaxID=196816 RepID=UPI0015D16A90|nr:MULTISPECIES: hypothetical protein [unclassified Acinetobacter]
MHIKFTKHGKGCPRKAVGYLLAEKDAKGDLRPDIQTLRGDAQTFVAITESLDFDYRYSSAVIAWSKQDNPTDAQIQETLDQFEKHAFADLDPTRYHMNAVLHVAQDGSKHVHVLVPRVDLGTGKSLNIAPPGHEKYFDKLRDYLNEKHCWSKPDDLAILKADVQLPHHTHSQRLAAIEINFAGKTKPEKKELLNKIVAQRINAGVIQDRNDVVQTLAEYGIITRNAKDTISVKLHGDKTAVKLGGEFYKDGFNVTAYAENRARAEADQSASRANEVDAKRVNELYNKLQRATESRARFFADKYQVPIEIYRQRNTAELSELDQQRTRAKGISAEADAQINRAIESGTKFSETSRKFEYSELSSTADTATTAENQSNFVSIMYSITANPDHNFMGEVNERIKAVNQSASQFATETERATADLYQRAEEVHRALRTAQHSTNSANEPSTKARYVAVFTDIRNASAKTFAREIAYCTGQLEHRKISAEQDQSRTKTNSGRYTAHTIAINESTFDSIIIEYSNRQRNQRQRVKQQASEARTFSQQLDRTTKHIDLIARQLSNVVIKPKPCTDLTRYFKNNGYRSPTAERIAVWSERQHEAFKNRNIEQVAYYIETKFQELGHYQHYENGLSRDEIDIVNKMIRNDERIIDYMKKSGCHLNYDTRQKLNRTFSLERTSNEYRLNDLDKKENEVKPLFQAKPETKAIERNNDNGFTM